MEAFFLIAGYFASMILRRERREDWLRRRFTRLGIPLLISAAILIPLQTMILPIFFGMSFFDILHVVGTHMFSSPLAWVDYLWFLYELIIDSMLVAAAWPIILRVRNVQMPDALRASPFLTMLVLVGLAAFPLTYLATLIDGETIGKIVDRWLHNGVFFLLGAVLFLRHSFFDRWLAWHWWRGALAAAILIAAVTLALGGHHYRPAMLACWFAAIGGTWLTLAAMKRWGDAPSAKITLLVDASLTIYLVHHPIIRALGLITAMTSLPAEVEWLAVCILTLALSLGFYFITRQSPVLFYMFNGRPLSVDPARVVATV